MKKGFIFLFLVLILAFVNLAMTSSVKQDLSVNVEKAVYEKLENHDKVKVVVRLYDETKQAYGKRIATQATGKDEIVNALAKTGDDDFNLVYKAESINGFTAEISSSALEELKKNPSVKYVKIEQEVRLSLQDSVPIVNATLVWPKQISPTNITGDGQTICIVDTGINYTHTDLGGCLGMNCRVLGGYAFYNPFNSLNKTDVMDDNGHGTHVAGIAGANGTITGIAPGVKFVAVKACGPDSSCPTQSIIDSVNWCVGNASLYNISVISMSLGGSNYSSYCDDVDADMTAAVDAAIAKNITVVVATGNDYLTMNISWPACIRNSTAVGSTTKADAVSSFSNRNNITIVLAPGSSITSTSKNGATESRSGTSMATPTVSGAVALLKQYKKLEKNINLTTVQIKDILNRTGKRIIDTSSGLNLSRLNVYAALVDIDTTAPNISIFSPQNKTYATNTSLPLNFTITDNLNLTNCWYAIDSNANVTLQNCVNSTFNSSLGNHTLYLYANDSKGNENSSYVLFTASLNPVVNLISPPNATLNGTNLTQTFSCNASDGDGLQNMTFYVWNSTAQVHANTSNKSGETYNQTNFSYSLPHEGTFKWNCRAYDNASNFSWASNGNYTITFLDYNISACRNITLAGKYSMNKSIQDRNTTSCIMITSSDVEVDCLGYQINGTNQSATTFDHEGINASTSDPSVSNDAVKLTNITIRDCNLINWTYGIKLSNVFNSTITNANFSNNTFGSYLYFSSNNNITNLSVSDTLLYSMYILVNSQNNLINNSILTRGYYGIVLSNATNNIIGTNRITSHSFSGIYLDNSANFNIIKNNSITSNTDYGVEIRDASHNILDSNYLVSNGMAVILSGNSLNNTISNSTQKNSTNYDINLTNISMELDKLVAERYLFLNSTLTLKNSSYIRINFPNVTQNGTNLSADVIMRHNYTFVNSSNAVGLNRSANITFFNLQLNNPRILRDGVACPSAICTKTTYNSSNGTLIFNVTGFSTYYAEDYCGNGYCESAESCSSCSSDCGNCPASTSSGGGGGGGGGGGATIYSEGNLAEGREINKLLKKYDEIKFSLRGNEHILNIKSVQKDSVIFELNSTSLNFTLAISESRKFNLSDEKFYDLYIKLNNITNFKANLSMTAILEEIPSVTKIKNETDTINQTQAVSEEKNESIEAKEIIIKEKKGLLSDRTFLFGVIIVASVFAAFLSYKLLKRSRVIWRFAKFVGRRI